MRHHLVLFQPAGQRGEIREGASVLEAARNLGVPLESLCGGRGTCGKCRVRLETGAFAREGIASLPAHLSPLTREEKALLSPEEQAAGMRLACQALVQGPLLLFVPEESRGGVQIVRKDAQGWQCDANPAVALHSVSVPRPTFASPLGAAERLTASLRGLFPGPPLPVDLPALRELPRTLRQGNGAVTVAVWHRREIRAVWPGIRRDGFGVAVDLGTTTVAAYLCHLGEGRVLATAAMMNPQAACGEDVMSRLTYAQDHPEDGADRLQEMIVGAVNRLVSALTAEEGLAPRDVLEMVVVGNTAMHHLFLRIDTSALGISPFPPAVHGSLDLRARDLGLRLHPGANVHVLPIEAGFVGADNMGVLLAVAPHRQDERILVIDVGTNGELVFGNRQGLVSASCATGPALEGAHIRYGMRAAAGAIEAIRIDPETLETSFTVIGAQEGPSAPPEPKARGICGSGIIDGVAELLRAGIIDQTGRFCPPRPSPRLRREEGKPAFVVAWANETAINRDIVITQQDIRNVQLAKGALYAGAKLLMRRLGSVRPDRVILAGAFGSYIDPGKALRIGLFPPCDLDRVTAAGNAAGQGACLALLDQDKRSEAEELARRVRYVELTIEKDFSQELMDALYFPHRQDPFPA